MRSASGRCLACLRLRSWLCAAVAAGVARSAHDGRASQLLRTAGGPSQLAQAGLPPAVSTAASAPAVLPGSAQAAVGLGQLPPVVGSDVPAVAFSPGGAPGALAAGGPLPPGVAGTQQGMMTTHVAPADVALGAAPSGLEAVGLSDAAASAGGAHAGYAKTASVLANATANGTNGTNGTNGSNGTASGGTDGAPSGGTNGTANSTNDSNTSNATNGGMNGTVAEAAKKPETRQLDLRQREECQEINDKAMRILMSDLTTRSKRGQTITAENKDLLAHLSIGSFSVETLKELQDEFSSLSLGAAIRQSFSWTLDDLQEFSDCNSGRSVGRLEENEQTADGQRLVQGDMVATPTQIKGQAGNGGSAGETVLLELAAEESLLRMPAKIWRNGLVPYCFTGSVNDRARNAFEQAVAHVKMQVPCLAFQPLNLSVTSGDACETTPSILVTDEGSGCYSYVGRADVGESRSQKLNLGQGCEFMGLALHQLCHALGMAHTTSRKDRDQFVQVMKDNAKALNTFEVDFAANDPAYAGNRFDYFSIMNFPSFAFTAHGQPTVLVKSDLRLSVFLGQRLGLSQDDVAHLAEMYFCADSAKPKTRTSMLASMLNRGAGYDDGLCSDDETTGIVYGSKLVSCDELREAGHCEHDSLKARVVQNCPVSCMRCVPKLFPHPGVRLKKSVMSLAERSAARGAVQQQQASLVDEVSETSLLQAEELGLRRHNCIDEAVSGLRDATGAPRPCSDVQSLCKSGASERVSKLLSEQCPKTCGYCDLAMVEDSMDCFDGPNDAAPAYEFAGVNASCEQLLHFCNDDPKLLYKCRKTCKACNSNATKVVMDVTPKDDSGNNSVIYSEIKKDIGCSRRRGFGLCSTRRRRDDI